MVAKSVSGGNMGAAPLSLRRKNRSAAQSAGTAFRYLMGFPARASSHAEEHEPALAAEKKLRSLSRRY